jgi:hypothetical protein
MADMRGLSTATGDDGARSKDDGASAKDDGTSKAWVKVNGDGDDAIGGIIGGAVGEPAEDE